MLQPSGAPFTLFSSVQCSAVTWSLGILGEVYKIKICNCVVPVCKCKFKEKFHHTHGHYFGPFQFVKRFSWPLTFFFLTSE